MADTPEKETGATPDYPPNNERLAGAREEVFSEKRNRSSSRNGSGRVEKRIEATMANAEPASTARSRKSSHILGLFKENTASREQKRNQVRTGSGVLKQDRLAETQSEETETLRLRRCPMLATSTIGSSADNQAITDSEESPTKDNESLEQYSSFSEDTKKRQSDRRPSTGAAAPKPLADVSHAPQGHDEPSKEGSTDKSRKLSHRFDYKSEGGLPLKLLEEIRNYHNLAAPFKDKFRPKSPDSDLDVEDLSVTPKTNEALLDHFQDTAATGEEEDDSDKEQISSALYYPHQAPSPDALQDVSIDSLDELEDSQHELESLKSGVNSATTDDDEVPSEDVDIALQSRNESRYLHGDLQKARMPSDDRYANAIESGISSPSEPEFDSPDEGARSTNGEDSSTTDDGETTPKATPKARSPFLRAKPRRDHRVPAAPLGAVELKPYNHQVGGHTTVFRFSKRAVCKQLSNRENEFYEVVERRHPELLRFLPRYDVSFL